MRIAITPMTTNISMSVNPRRLTNGFIRSASHAIVNTTVSAPLGESISIKSARHAQAQK